MAVRSKPLWLGVQATTTGAEAYVCPAGETAIVKDITLYNSTGAAVVVTLLCNGTGLGNIIWRGSIPAGTTVQLLERFIVLSEFMDIWLAAPVGGIYGAGFGAELEGVAD